MKAITTFASVTLIACLSTSVSAQLLPGERETRITAIPGVVAADAKWQLIWADFETADGIVGTPDGGVVFAQEQTDTIRKLDRRRRGANARSRDARRGLGVPRFERPPVRRRAHLHGAAEHVARRLQRASDDQHSVARAARARGELSRR